MRVLTVAVCLAAAPAAPPIPAAPAAVAEPVPAAGDRPTDAGFAELVKRDIVAALEATLRRHKADVRGYRCAFQKQERVSGRLGPVEVIRVAFRDDPFAVLFRWEQGAGSATATLYAKGENGGKMLADSKLLGVMGVDPDGLLPRQSSRYSIKDFGLYFGCLRTYRKWKDARAAGTLHVEYLGTRPVTECGGRVCHVVRRTCDPLDADNFSLDEPGAKDPARHPKEAIRSVTFMLDAETWQQVGSEVRHPDGGLLGAYYFRDIEVNPTFPPDRFTAAGLRK